MTVIKQRKRRDCGIAALATLLSGRRVSYRHVYAAARTLEREHHIGSGLLNRHIVAIARKVGLELVPKRRYDLSHDAGVLRLYGDDTPPGGHFVAVRYGLVWDPADGRAVPWRKYQALHRAEFGTLLRA